MLWQAIKVMHKLNLFRDTGTYRMGKKKRVPFSYQYLRIKQPIAFSLSGLFSYVVNLANMKFQVDSAKTRDAMNKLRKWTFSDKVQAFHQPRKQLFKSSNRNMFQQQGKSRG